MSGFLLWAEIWVIYLALKARVPAPLALSLIFKDIDTKEAVNIITVPRSIVDEGRYFIITGIR